MIKNIIFDFGDIFINLDKDVMLKAAEKFGGTPQSAHTVNSLNNLLEVGKMSPEIFVSEVQNSYPLASKTDITNVWNSMLLDFPDYRLEFIEALAASKQYRLFLLSNTNGIHIPYVADQMGAEKFNRFKNCFEQFYLSHEIGMRKPNAEIFEFVLNQNSLVANETLFVDDNKDNTLSAEKLGIKCWHLQVGKEDVIDLKDHF